MKFEVGQIYECVTSSIRWWTKGKRYSVHNSNYGLVLIDDDGTYWHDNELLSDIIFKLVDSDKTLSGELDLNELTLEELGEYVTIMRAYNSAEIELNNFIKRVTK